MNYTTYLFDFDYTLADSSRGIVLCFRNVLNQHQYTDVTDEAIKRTIGKTLEESFSILTGISDAEQLSVFKEEYQKESDIHMTVNTVFYADTVTTLTTLKQQGARLGIVSTKYRFLIKEMLQQHFPDDWFDIIIGGEDIKQAKPNPEGLLLAIEQLNAAPEETLYIGDSIVDAETAQAAGITFVGVTTGMTNNEELSEYPHEAIIENLKELLPSQAEKAVTQTKRGFNLQTLKKYIRLRHITQIRGRVTPPPLTEQYTCRNCGNTFTGHYCNNCAQDKNTPRYTLRSAIQNILGGMTNIDHGFGYTLIELLLRPGYMINDYMAGKRVRYFRPFQTLFVLAAIYILLVEIIDPNALKEKAEETPISTKQELVEMHDKAVKQFNASRDSVSKKSLQLIANTLQIEIAKADSIEQAKLAEEKRENEKDAKDNTGFDNGINAAVKAADLPFISSVASLLNRWAHGNKAVTIILMLPVFALATRWAFRKRTYNRHYNFTELVFAQAYMACQVLLVSIFYFPFNGKADVSSLFDLPWWAIFLLSLWVYKQLFRGSWIQTTKRTMLMYLYSFFIILTLAIVVLCFLVLVGMVFNGQ